MVEFPIVVSSTTTSTTEKRALGGTAGSSKPNSFESAKDILSQSILWAQQPQQVPQQRESAIGGRTRVGPSQYSTMDSTMTNDHDVGQVNPARTGQGLRQDTIGARQQLPPQQEQQRQFETSKNEASTGGGGGDSSAAKMLLLTQLAIIFCFLLFVSYDDEANAKPSKSSSHSVSPGSGSSGDQDEEPPNSLPSYYPMFQDVHVMIFIGFGFLMTFLRKYGFSAVGYNFMIAAIAIQWSVLCRGVFHHEGNSIQISITSLINGDFAAGAVLISFGAILGVSSPLQLLVMCLIEVFLYAANEYVGTELLKAIDVGGSMYIHTFGAYFGLAVSFILRRNNECESDKEGSSYTSDVFAMIGTVFLWLFWPSFNGAMATGDDQHRAVLNTVLSLSGSCLLSFAMSSLLSPDNKFNMVHIQNASLAGGVAVGAVADLMIKPFGALIIGSGAGILSTAGYVYLTPLLQRTIGLHDTCGVHNLHGMPGVVAGLIGALMAAIATENDYGKSLYIQYPARAPLNGSSELMTLRQDLVRAQPGLNRTATEQAIYQLAALGVTLLIGLVGGAITGTILRIPLFSKVPKEKLFDDGHLWQVEEDSETPSSVVEHSQSKYKDSPM